MAIQAQTIYSDSIGLPLCGGFPEWIDGGCGGEFNPFAFSFQQQKLQQFQEQERILQLQYLQQRNHTLFSDSTSNVKNREFVGFFDQQKQEIDHYIRSRGERLRLLLQEQRKQQVGVMMKKIESSASVLLRQKDDEIARAADKTMELENLLRKLEMENQTWQRVAQESEAMVVSLNNTLEQLRENASPCFNNDAGDAESCCEVNGEGKKTEAEEEVQGRNPETTMVCKCCNSRSSCILLLPCRHLCSCKDCEPLLDSCPVCRKGKKASIEALIFWGEEFSGKIGRSSQNRERKSDDQYHGAWREVEQNQCVW